MAAEMAGKPHWSVDPVTGGDVVHDKRWSGHTLRRDYMCAGSGKRFMDALRPGWRQHFKKSVPMRTRVRREDKHLRRQEVRAAAACHDAE